MKVIQKIGCVVFPAVFVVSFILSVSSVLYAQPEEIELCVDKNRGPVLFPHELHMDGYDCLDCHHDYQDGKNVLEDAEEADDLTCASCHNAEAKIKVREAFHGQCMGCHDRYKMTTKKTGPSLCGECHILQK